MRRFDPFGVVLACLLTGLAAGVFVAYIAMPVSAQSLTPVPGRHSEVRTPFVFYVKDTPAQLGWRLAEFKDEGGQSYYKADVVPGCGEWVVAPGTWPGLVLDPGGTDCPGFVIDFGVLYWFSAPPIVVTPSPSLPPPTATVTPPFDGATATPSPSPTVTVAVTVTPSPPGRTPTPTPTRSPIGTPTVLFGNMCDPRPTPIYPHSITIYGQGGLNAPAMFWYCVPNATPDAIFIVPKATFEAAYDNGPRKLLEDLGK